MSQSEVRERFATLAASSNEQIDLAEAALLIAAETTDVDVGAYLGQLDGLAKAFEDSYDPATALGVSVSSLSDFIHVHEGFAGNVKNYYDPENSYLNRVIDTRRGIPISLALIHISLGQRLDLPVGGINFPGHFLVRYGGADKHLIVDPFSGRMLSESDCANLLRQLSGNRVKLEPSHFEFAPTKDILARMLDNLKQIFWREKSWTNSRACVERQLLLRPRQSEYLIQLGALYEMQGEPQQAQSLYTDVLQSSEDEQLRSVASKRLLSLTPRAPTVH